MAEAFLATVRTSYDVAFLDPPYAYEDWPSLLAAVPADIVVIERNRVIDPGEGWSEIKTARYGLATISVLERHSVLDGDDGVPSA